MRKFLYILLLLICCKMDAQRLLVNGHRYAAPATPVSISSFDTKVNPSAATVHSLTGVPAGALLVLTTTAASDGDYVIKHAVVTSSPSLTWTKQVDAQASLSSNAEIWTAVYTAGGNINVTSNWDSDYQSSVCYVVLNAEAVLGGASATGLAQAAPSVTLSTTKDNSILFVISSDWNAVDGASRAYRGTPTERYYASVPGVTASTYHYTYAAGVMGSKTVGISSPSTMSAGTAVLEIRGAGSSGGGGGGGESYSLVFSTGYESAGDVTTTQGQFNTRSTTIKKDGTGSFRSEVQVNQPQLFGGYRGEMQYSDYDYVSEGHRPYLRYTGYFISRYDNSRDFFCNQFK